MDAISPRFPVQIGASFDELVDLLQSNPRYVFGIVKRDKIDKRPTRSRVEGWADVMHKQHDGVIRLSRSNGLCRAVVTDDSGGLKLIGTWTSWLASNANDLIAGIDVRFETKS